MLTAILGLLGSASTLGAQAFAWLAQRTQAEVVLGAPIVAGATKAVDDEFSWPETRWMIALTIGAFNLHLWAVVIDSVFLHWHVIDRLPAPMDSWEGTVLLAPFALAGTLGLVTRIFGK